MNDQQREAPWNLGRKLGQKLARRARTLGLAPRRACLGLLLVLGLSAAGCEKGTFLEVRFIGATALEIQAIRIELALTAPDGGVQHSMDTVRPGGGIKLPTSMAFKLDTESGDLQVKATALGPANVELASDSALTTIKHGETWTITLRFGLAANTDDPADQTPQDGGS